MSQKQSKSKNIKQTSHGSMVLLASNCFNKVTKNGPENTDGCM